MEYLTSESLSKFDPSVEGTVVANFPQSIYSSGTMAGMSGISFGGMIGGGNGCTNLDNANFGTVNSFNYGQNNGMGNINGGFDWFAATQWPNSYYPVNPPIVLNQFNLVDLVHRKCRLLWL